MRTQTPTVQLVSQRFDALESALPPLPSAEFMRLLQTADAATLPAQVLARAYRRALAENLDDAAEAILARLLDQGDPHGYLKTIRFLARKQTPRGQGWHDEDDLFQAAVMEMLKVLRTDRGQLAELAWTRFSQNCFEDAWRIFHGRRGERLRQEFVDPMTDDETGEMIFHVEQTDGADAPWHAGAKQSALPQVEKIIYTTIQSMSDPLMKTVAMDQFGTDPSPISAGRSPGGKAPLTELTGASRFQISRALRNARARLAAALLADPELEFDTQWLRQFAEV
ncbi:MAG: hypothetical protein ACKV2V_29060 [Blastocatellia bacterium]